MLVTGYRDFSDQTVTGWLVTYSMSDAKGQRLIETVNALPVHEHHTRNNLWAQGAALIRTDRRSINTIQYI